MNYKNQSLNQLCLLLITSFLVINGFSFAQTSGGPDTYGYTWIDSDDPNGPVYNWIDITSTGTLVTGLADDNAVGPISMTDFEYYGQTVNQLKIGSNGWISFDDIANISHCFPSIPTAGGSGDNLLAPYMSDINFAGAANPGEVYYYDDVVNDRFIVSYINAPKWINATVDYVGSNTFQVILDRTDFSIYFQYNSMDQTFDDVAGCSTDIVVGIENNDGSDGLLHSTQTTFQDSYVILFDSPYCAVSSTISETACGSYTSPSGNYIWTSSNTYMDTVSTPAGCDSIITINLTINSVDSSVTQVGEMLTSNEVGGTYQWLNCPVMTTITGATSQSYTAIANGDYAVVVTNGLCSDTSSCYTVSGVGLIENNFDNNLIVYPNPTDGHFSIELGDNFETTNVTITNLTGKIVQSMTFDNSQMLSVNLNESVGVYFLFIQSADKKAVIRLVKD